MKKNKEQDLFVVDNTIKEELDKYWTTKKIHN